MNTIVKIQTQIITKYKMITKQHSSGMTIDIVIDINGSNVVSEGNVVKIVEFEMDCNVVFTSRVTVVAVDWVV